MVSINQRYLIHSRYGIENNLYSDSVGLVESHVGSGQVELGTTCLTNYVHYVNWADEFLHLSFVFSNQNLSASNIQIQPYI